MQQHVLQFFEQYQSIAVGISLLISIMIAIQVSWVTFALASSLGKAPALLIEAYSVYQVSQFGWQGKGILALSALFLFYLAWKKIR